MIDVKRFREDGYLYDSLENYSNLMEFQKFIDIKSKIDEKNIKRHSKYEYWYKFKNLSYIEEIAYDNFLKRDDNLKIADYIYEKSHSSIFLIIYSCDFS